MKKISKILLTFLLLWGFFLTVEARLMSKIRHKKSNRGAQFVPSQVDLYDKEYGLAPLQHPGVGIYG